MELNQSHIRVSDLMQIWLADLQGTVRPTSFSVYQSEVHNHILPVLGQLHLGELSADSGENLAAELTAKGLSPRTVKDVAGKLGQALRWGVERGYDVPILKELPLERAKQEIRFLQPEESARLEASLTGDDDDLINVILLTWKAGLTIGEACALTCGDIDWEKKSITVRRLCQRVAGGLTYSEEEPRVVPLPEGLRRAKNSVENDFFIRSSRGGGAEPRLCQGWLKKHMKGIGLPEDIGFAVFRNSYIRDLMESGMDFIQVSRLSGSKDLNELWRKFGMFYRPNKA